MRKILTDAQITEVISLYFDQKLSATEIAKLFNCNRTTIERWIKKSNHQLRDNSHCKQKYPINENIFDIIDTEEKAYWLGFLYADGNVSKTNRTRLSLAKEDIEIVKKFSNFIFGQERVKIYERPENKISFQDLVYVDVCNKHIAQTLTKLGCPPKKTFILTFPSWLDENLWNHFIRGYFDGDGCLSNYKEKQRGRGKYTKDIFVSEHKRAHFSILSTKEFLTSVRSIFSELNINSSMSKRHKERKNNNFNLTVSGNRQIQRLMDWLYLDATIFLERKHSKYLELKVINQ